MLHTAFQSITYLHIFAGACSLIIFWLPVLSRKGSKQHVRFGQYFVNLMYTVSLTGIIMSLLVFVDPIAVRQPTTPMTEEQLARFLSINQSAALFLMMLSLLVITNVRQSKLVLKAKADRTLLKRPMELSLVIVLGIAGVYVGYLGVTKGLVLLQIFAGVGIFNSAATLHYIFKSQIKPKEWIIAHFGNIIGAGIGSYTAFIAFGGRAFFAELLTGYWQLLPWTLPATIGLIATAFLNKKYKRQYKIV